MSHLIKESHISHKIIYPANREANSESYKAAFQESLVHYQRFPKTILKTFDSNPALKQASEANGKINLSDFWPRLSVFVDENVQIDELNFDPISQTISGDLGTIAEKLKELALLYSDFKLPTSLSPLQQIDHFYTFLMSHFKDETETAPTFELPSVSLHPERVAEHAPNTVFQELMAMIKNPKNWVKVLILAVISVFTFQPALFVPVLILFFSIALTIHHFVGIEERNRQWHAMKKLREASRHLVPVEHLPQPVLQPQPVSEVRIDIRDQIDNAVEPDASADLAENRSSSPVSPRRIENSEEREEEPQAALPRIELPESAPVAAKTEQKNELPESPVSDRPPSPASSLVRTDSDSKSSSSDEAETRSLMSVDSFSEQEPLDHIDAAEENSPKKTLLSEVVGKVRNVLPNTLTWVRSWIPRNPFQSSSSGI